MKNMHSQICSGLTRRGSGVRITDLAETLGYVFERRNMKKAATLDPNAQKN